MSAPPRFLSPFVRTRTRLTLTLGLVLAALTAALLPWWQGSEPSTPAARTPVDARPAGTGPRDENAAAAEARRTGKEVVVDTATTATEMTWAQPGGGLRTRINALPVRARNAQGKWAAVDNRLRVVGDGVRPVNPVVPVRFSAGSAMGSSRADRSYARQPLTGVDSFLAETVLAGHTVTYTWPGALPEPVLDGPRALYSEVLPGVDLLLVAREEGGLAQLLIVKGRTSAASLATVSYGLKSPTASFRYDAGAVRVLVLDASRREVGSIPTPFAWDSSGRDPELPVGEVARTSVASPADVLKLSGLSGIEPGARQAPTPVRLAGDGTRDARLELRVADTGLLDDPAVRFPLFVDPPLNSGWLAWTVAYKPYPNSSFWNGTNFSSGTSDARVGRENDTNGTARSFWRMNYSTSLKGASVSKATFTVLNNHSWSCTKREFQFWLTGSISSGTTWNKQPSWSDEIQRKSFAHGWSSADCPDDYEEFNVRTAAQTGADKGWSNITFGMRATSESDTQTWRKFKATSAEMNVTYNRDPAVPSSVSSAPGGTCSTAAAGRTIGKTNVVLSAKSTDPDGNLSALRFRFWKKDAAVPAGTLVTVGSGKATLTIPSSSLVDKGVYYWNVRAEDSGDGRSAYYPASGNCTLTVDGSAPPPPDVDSEVFLAATDDGATWATVKFGKPGAVTFTSSGAAKFRYAVDGLNWKDAPTPTAGVSTVPDLTPKHAGPNTLNVIAYDSVGNPSKTTNYTFYLPPRDIGDAPGDTTGDALPDLLVVDADGKLINCVGDEGGELNECLDAAYTSDGTLNPAGHWYNASTGKAALITHYADAYPGDGVTDLFAVTPDGGFWLYPGDGYGSFDVGKRLKIFLPSNAPAPSTWIQLKAIGDITGDGLPDIALRSGLTYWVLSGYTGGKFQTATLMNADAWARRDIVNIADINADDVPDLLWRNLDNGNMYVRHGKPGSVAGSVALDSLKTAAASLNGDVAYGTSWTEANVSTALGIPDVNKDGVPDIWARFGADGQVKVYYPSQANTNAPVKVVQPLDWRTVRALG
ncbi:DNRLRE domain-containing protein [Streptomyces acidiscabies]|uniref:DNRLRE domain-containing protein n=1 Tax=Streptomyces acidiscabies TaxID=42234 RepID=UPI0009522110|nr:DNRLRE domain-containing protein [Streptomyces acidiscabies]